MKVQFTSIILLIAEMPRGYGKNKKEEEENNKTILYLQWLIYHKKPVTIIILKAIHQLLRC